MAKVENELLTNVFNVNKVNYGRESSSQGWVPCRDVKAEICINYKRIYKYLRVTYAQPYESPGAFVCTEEEN